MLGLLLTMAKNVDILLLVLRYDIIVIGPLAAAAAAAAAAVTQSKESSQRS